MNKGHKYFEKRMEAIEWIAAHVADEGQFEVMRERLNYNYIYTGKYFLDLDKKIGDVMLMGHDEEE